MHDLVIRNGKIVDGTGQPARSGDIAIDGGVIASVGGKAGAGRRELDAGGLLVTPGWVDSIAIMMARSLGTPTSLLRAGMA